MRRFYANTVPFYIGGMNICAWGMVTEPILQDSKGLHLSDVIVGKCYSPVYL